jgi:beta-lactam-binding protein with PASTA domain
VSLATRIASVFRSIAIVIAIAVVFLFGVATTVYLSLRSPETTVPDVVGKNRFEAEKILAEADLKFRVRATRPSNQAHDTVMFQLPRAGEVVKAGQTVAMDISRPTKEGETSETVTPDEPSESRNTNASNSNERPRRPRPRNTNENANSNTNANSNRNANSNTNRPANINRPNANAAVNANTTPRANVNRGNVNARPANVNARPPAPRPSPPRP